MVFRMKNASATFQRSMRKAFSINFFPVIPKNTVKGEASTRRDYIVLKQETSGYPNDIQSIESYVFIQKQPYALHMDVTTPLI